MQSTIVNLEKRNRRLSAMLLGAVGLLALVAAVSILLLN